MINLAITKLEAVNEPVNEPAKQYGLYSNATNGAFSLPDEDVYL